MCVFIPRISIGFIGITHLLPCFCLLSSCDYFHLTVMNITLLVPFCMLYALTAFVTLLKVKCANSKLISLVSSTFLFVYAFHIALLGPVFRAFYSKFDLLFPPVISFFSIEYLLGALLMICLGMLVMKIPFMSRAFRI